MPAPEPRAHWGSGSLRRVNALHRRLRQLGDVGGVGTGPAIGYGDVSPSRKGRHPLGVANDLVAISLGGYLASPAANIKISCKDVTSVSGKIRFNASGNSKDSAIWGVRINFLEHPIPANDNDFIEKIAA